MIVKIHPARCCGTVRVPPSKSMAHRALLCAAFADGVSELSGITGSEDMEATLGALEALGCKVEREGDVCRVTGCGGFPKGLPEGISVDCRESGSALRFLIPIFALGPQTTVFTGHGRLMERSQSVYEQLFAERGLLFEKKDGALVVRGPLKSGDYELSGNVSSQFITGLLYALPLLPGASRILIKPPFQSRGYVDLTLQMLRHFGVRAWFEGEYTLIIPGGQRYRATDYAVEGDYSQCAFFAVLAALQGGIKLTNLRSDSLQGDRVILDILRRCGAKLAEDADSVSFDAASLAGAQIDVGDCPDLAPILSVMGMYAAGETRLNNAARLRDKESDRIEAMETELRKLGVSVSSTRDSMTIPGCAGAPAFPETTVHGHNDHRIVMSLAIAATLGGAPLVIEDAQAIRKTYPDFFEVLASIGGRIEVVHE